MVEMDSDIILVTNRKWKWLHPCTVTSEANLSAHRLPVTDKYKQFCDSPVWSLDMGRVNTGVLKGIFMVV